MMDGHFIDGSYSAFQASINNTFSFFLSYLSLLSKDNNKLRKSNDFLLFFFSSLNAYKVIPIKKKRMSRDLKWFSLQFSLLFWLFWVLTIIGLSLSRAVSRSLFHALTVLCSSSLSIVCSQKPFSHLIRLMLDWFLHNTVLCELFEVSVVWCACVRTLQHSVGTLFFAFL